MNIIKKLKERRSQNKKLQQLSVYAGCFNSLNIMADRGLIEWNQKLRQLYIDSSLAFVMMRTPESWKNFINNIFLWQYSRECDHAWADYFQKEELKSVREASKKYASLSRKDVERIREARRQEILQSDIEPPKVEGFEFFIVSPPASSELPGPDPQTGQPVGRLTAVGHYDPDTGQMEMALWADVEHLIKNSTAQ